MSNTQQFLRLSSRALRIATPFIFMCCLAIGQELLKNPSFESSRPSPSEIKSKKYDTSWQVKGERLASDWTPNDSRPGTFELITSSEGAARTGQNFVRLTSNGKRLDVYQRTNEIRPFRWYLLSAWARGGALCIDVYEYATGKWVRSKPLLAKKGGEGRWEKVWAPYQVPSEEVDIVGFAFGVSDGETVDVDDVSLQPIAAPPTNERLVIHIAESICRGGKLRPPEPPGFVEEVSSDKLCTRSVQSNVFQYKCAQAAKSSAPLSLPLQGVGRSAVDLAFAECAAFGLTVLPFDGEKEIAERYRNFLSKRPDLYQGLESFGKVGILYFADGAPAHAEEAAYAASTLAQHQVPFDLLTKEMVAQEDLSRYPVLIVPALVAADDKTVDVLTRYLDSGGAVAASGDTFRSDPKGGKRSATLIDRAPFARTESKIRTATIGKGRLLHVPQQFDEESLWQGIREGIPAGPILIVRRTGEPVRVNAFRNKAGTITLHIVNYGVTAKNGPVRVERLPILLAIPEGRKVSSVVAYAPDRAEGTSCQFVQFEDQVVFHVPEINAYAVIEVNSR